MILTVNLVFAAFLAGLHWYLQIVHYPLFSYIEKKPFIEYHINHLKRNIFILFIPMLAEGAFSILLAFDYPSLLNPMIPILCLCISTGLWLYTFSNIAPLQDKLTTDGFDKEVIKKLEETNWIRTMGWTVKTILLIYCMTKVTFLA